MCYTETDIKLCYLNTLLFSNTPREELKSSLSDKLMHMFSFIK